MATTNTPRWTGFGECDCCCFRGSHDQYDVWSCRNERYTTWLVVREQDSHCPGDYSSYPEFIHQGIRDNIAKGESTPETTALFAVIDRIQDLST